MIFYSDICPFDKTFHDLFAFVQVEKHQHLREKIQNKNILCRKKTPSIIKPFCYGGSQYSIIVFIIIDTSVRLTCSYSDVLTRSWWPWRSLQLCFRRAGEPVRWKVPKKNAPPPKTGSLLGCFIAEEDESSF